MKILLVGALCVLSSVSVVAPTDKESTKSEGFPAYKNQATLSPSEMVFKIPEIPTEVENNKSCSSIKCWDAIVQKKL